ncbi:MAG: hypothetical protein AAF243_06810 [Cyanobacteria bacterium P01_A01_bin.137]
MGQCSKKTILPLVVAASAVVAGVGSSIPAFSQALPGPVLPAIGDPATLARLTADLSYPNSSQRFFKAGNNQIELEIRRLLEDDQPEPLLTIRSDAREQFED